MKQIILSETSIIPTIGLAQIDENKYFLLKKKSDSYFYFARNEGDRVGSGFIFRSCQERAYHWNGYHSSMRKLIETALIKSPDIEVFQFDSFLELVKFFIDIKLDSFLDW